VPEEVKDMLRHYLIRYSGPAGMTERINEENARGFYSGWPRAMEPKN